MRGSRGRAVVLGVLVGLWLVAGSMPALAHSFLVETRPAQGTRLATPPDEIALQLSEAVAPETVSIDVRGAANLEVGRPETSSDGRVVRLPFVEPPQGVVTVAWQLTSAVDGHSSLGEFSFASGDVGAATPDSAPGSATTEFPSVMEAVATWLLFGGFGVASATWLLAGRVNDALVAAFPGTARGWLATGVGLSLAGLLLRALLADAAAVPMGIPGLLAAGMLAIALLLSRWKAVWPSLIALATAALSWAARGHAATLHGALGWLLDAAHLGAAGVWIGGLVAVVVAMARRRAGVGEASTMPLVRRYAKGAAAAVAVLLISGVASATLLVSGWQQLLGSGYGNLVTIKIVLAAVAVGLALAARRWMLPAARIRGLRRLTRPELGVLVAALAVAAVLIEVAPPEPELDAEWLLGAPPMEGQVARTAGMAGQLMLDVQAGEGRLDVNVRGASGGIDSDLVLTATLPSGRPAELHPRPCGAGCFTQPFDPPPGETVLSVEASAEGWQGGSAKLDFTWPPPPEEPERFERMRRTMLQTERLRVTEASDEYPPDASGGFEMDGEQLVQLMPWASGGVTSVRSVPGDPARFTFYLPGSTMWFDVTVDEQGRLLTQRLVNPGHDIRYRFAYPAADAADEEDAT